MIRFNCTRRVLRFGPLAINSPPTGQPARNIAQAWPRVRQQMEQIGHQDAVKFPSAQFSQGFFQRTVDDFDTRFVSLRAPMTESSGSALISHPLLQLPLGGSPSRSPPKERSGPCRESVSTIFRPAPHTGSSTTCCSETSTPASAKCAGRMRAVLDGHHGLQLLLEHLHGGAQPARVTVRQVVDEKVVNCGNADDLAKTAVGVGIGRGRAGHVVTGDTGFPEKPARGNRPLEARPSQRKNAACSLVNSATVCSPRRRTDSGTQRETPCTSGSEYFPDWSTS